MELAGCSSDGSLSPVLNSGSYRRVLHDRKKGKPKSKVKLLTKLESEPAQEAPKAVFAAINCLNNTLSELQCVAHDNVVGRLSMVRKLEKQKAVLQSFKYNNPPVGKNLDDFDFKKPISPVSVKKGVKSGISNIKSPEISVSDKIGANTDVSFMQMSISDTQLAFAADIADMVDVVSSSWMPHINSNVKESEECRGFEVCEFELSSQYLNKLKAIIQNLKAVYERDKYGKVCKHSSSEVGLHCSKKIKLAVSSQGVKCSFNIDDAFEESFVDDAPFVNVPNCLNESIDMKETEFCTANRKNIKISDGSTQRANSIFSNENVLIKNKNCSTSDKVDDSFPTASEKNFKIPDVPIKKGNCILNSLSHLNSTKKFIESRSDIWNEEAMSADQDVQELEMGFCTASGKNLKISDTAIQKANVFFGSEDVGSLGQLNNTNESTATKIEIGGSLSMGFSTASGKNIKIPNKAIQKASALFGNEDVCSLGQLKYVNESTVTKVEIGGSLAMDFSTESGKNIKIPDKAIQKAGVIFGSEDVYSLGQLTTALVKTKTNNISRTAANENKHQVVHEDKNGNSPSMGFCTASGKNIKIADGALQKANLLFDNENIGLPRSKCLKGCVNAEENAIEVSNRAYLSAGDRSESSGSTESLPHSALHDGVGCGEGGGFTTGAGSKIILSKSALSQAVSIFADLTSMESKKSGRNVKGPLQPDPQTTISTSPYAKQACSVQDIPLEDNTCKKQQNAFSCVTNSTKMKSTPLKRFPALNHAKTSGAKRRLGMSGCKQMSLSSTSLQKAVSIFEDKGDIKSPAAVTRNSFQSHLYTSTPVKETSVCRKSFPGTEKVLHKMNNSLLATADLTPIKHPVPKKLINQYVDAEQCQGSSSIRIQSCTGGGIESWIDQLNKEYEDLKSKMAIVMERKKVLEDQKRLIEDTDNEHRRKKLGILYNKKQSSRKHLKELVQNQNPGATIEILRENVSRQILEITSDNATSVHFVATPSQSTIHTTDGAILVPNSAGLIGLSEVEVAFKAMPGVDPKLIPKGWISNHFKWIVWKLASYERSFPGIFSDCLNIENIMQQLTYRYNKEIDQVQRPALRKILEKDDVPQKRMVLCVSNIIKISEYAFELELTDGWYCIRTIIDQPLCKQISASKIRIGTKLVVQSAEIVNCDGCHPLEVPNDVKLKINYNCTRRAVWHSKLGYQRVAEPFSVLLRTIYPDGGFVACVKVRIIRVYPLQYMERQAGKAVWRNKKAEERRAQQWTCERLKEAEVMQQKLQSDLSQQMRSAKRDLVGDLNWDLSEVSSPEVLYHMMESANDPESFKNMLSSSQLLSIKEYRSNIYAGYQQDVANRIKKQVHVERDVVSVLKLRVVDLMNNSNDSLILNVWKPTEEHVQFLKEGCAFFIYNVTPKFNGDLATNLKTHFKPETSDPSCSKLQRQLYPICALLQPSCSPSFNEYDTVGTVVQVQKDAHYQELWLTDCAARLLHVKILKGPGQCCLFDNINRGQSVVLMNLICRHPANEIAQAVANQTTVITGYPQHKFLQDGLVEHSDSLPKDLTELLNECDKKIYAHVAWSKGSASLVGSSLTNFSDADVLDDSSENNTVIPTRLTSTDIAMSLIDTDQYFKAV